MSVKAHLIRTKNRVARLGTAGVWLLLLTSAVEAQEHGNRVGAEDIRRPNDSVPSLPDPKRFDDITSPQILPPSEEDDLTIPLSSLSVSGAIVFTSDQLVQSYVDRIGEKVTLADLHRFAAEMTARYRNAGYILSQVYVPPQRIEGGHIKFAAIEGYLANVRFQGSVAPGIKRLQPVLSRDLASSRPLDSRELERQLLLLNDLPNTVAAGTLLASKTAGASDLVVHFATDPISFDASTDNRISRLLGDLQASANFGMSSLFGARNHLQLAYGQSSGEGSLKFGFGRFTHVAKSGSQFHFQASVADSTPALPIALLLLNIESDSRDASIQWDYPLRRSRRTNAKLFARLTLHEGITDETFFGTRTEDNIAAVRTGFTVDAVDRAGGVNVLQLEYHQGLDAFGASNIDDAGLSRNGGDPEFQKLTYYVARLQHLFSRWQVLFAVRGQYAFDNLLSPEEFAFGGDLFGRGYDSSELVGDHGIAGKIELRHVFSGDQEKGLTTYAFWDIGRVRQKGAPTETGGDDSAESFGLGIRASFGPRIAGFLEAAKPRQLVVAENSNDVRVFGGLTVRF